MGNYLLYSVTGYICHAINNSHYPNIFIKDYRLFHPIIQ